MTSRRKHIPHAQWVTFIHEQEVLGTSVEAFCRERDLGIHSFNQHRTRMRKDGDSCGGFVQVNTGSSSSGLRLVGGSWTLELDRDFDAVTLRRFLVVAGR